MKHIFYTLIAATICIHSFAQGFNTGTLKGTFSTGGSLQNTTGAQTVMGAYVNDSATGMIPIGFTYQLAGKSYDSVSISSNGFLRLGARCTPDAINNMASDTNVPLLAAYWYDIGTAYSVGYIKTLTSGTAPDRQFTVEWRCNVPWNGVPSPIFQATLYERNSAIQYDYQLMSGQSGYSIGVAAKIGNTRNYIQYNANNNVMVYNAGLSTSNYVSINAGSRIRFQPDTQLPHAPINMLLYPKAACIDVSWVDSSRTEQYFSLMRSTDNVHFTEIAQIASTTDTGEGQIYYYYDKLLQPSTRYYYSVRAMGMRYPSLPLLHDTTTTAPQLAGVRSIPTDYATIGAAMDDIYCRWLSGDLTLELEPGYTPTSETYPIQLNPKYNPGPTHRLILRPKSTVTDTIRFYSNSQAALYLNGNSYVNIDGRPGGQGSGKYIKYDCSVYNQPTVSLRKGANHCSLQYCTITSSNNTGTGSLSISTNATDTAAASYNLISNCNITGATNPLLYAGSAAQSTNSFDSLVDNNIYNCTDVGIYLGQGNDNWYLKGNSFYNTQSVALGATSGVIDMLIQDSVGGNHTIYGNFFGGTAPRCSGTARAIGNSFYRHFNNIAAQIARGKNIWLDGNAFQNTNITINILSTTTCALVEMQQGNLYAGTLQPNLFGDSTNATPLYTKINYLIHATPSLYSEINISNNQVHNITCAAGGDLFSVNGTANRNITISNNTIGSKARSSYINITGVAATLIHATTGADMVGKVTISNNHVANIIHNNTSGELWAITTDLAGRTQGLITNNLLDHLYSNSNYSQNSFSAALPLCGIHASGSNVMNLISSNTVQDIRLQTTVSNAPIYGIGTFWSNAAADNRITKNIVTNIYDNSGTFNTMGEGCKGIHADGAKLVANNIIQMGIDSAGNHSNYTTQLIAVGNGGKVAFNSIYMGKQQTGHSLGCSTTLSFQNNIVADLRDSANIFDAVTASDYNSYFYNKPSLTGQDIHSLRYTDPLYIRPAGATGTVDMHLQPASPELGAGHFDSEVYDDMNGNTRPQAPTIGAYELNPVTATDTIAPYITYTPMRDTIYMGQKKLYATISDSTGVAIYGTDKPMLYFKRNRGGSYVSSYGTLLAGSLRQSDWEFTFDSALVSRFMPGDTIYYFVTAQDISSHHNVGSARPGYAGSNVYTQSQLPSITDFFVLQSYTDTFPPVILYTPKADTLPAMVFTLNVRITDPSGVYTGGNNSPELYSKTGINGTWVGLTGTLISGDTWDGYYQFQFSGFMVPVGDSIFYFVAAADNNLRVASNPPGYICQDIFNINGTTLPPVLNYFIIRNQPVCNVHVATTVTNATCPTSTDGQISVLASGGITPYQYKTGINGTWQNASVFTQQMAGRDTIYVKDSVNCTQSAITTVGAGSSLTPSVVIAGRMLCTVPAIDTFDAVVTNGGTPAYQWYYNGIAVGTNSARYIHAGAAAGDSVWVIISGNYACAPASALTSNILYIATAPAVVPSAVITIYHDNYCASTLRQDTVFATMVHNGGYPHFQWYQNNSAVGTDAPLYVFTPVDRDTVWVVVTSTAACASPATVHSDTVSVAVSHTTSQSICLVTTDTATDHPEVIWEKADKYATDSFYIYRSLASGSSYSLIAALGRDSLSQWSDIGIAASSGSYRYKLALKDTCGNMSAQSDYHQSIFVTALGLGSFSWLPYAIENQPAPAGSYELWRDATSSGLWTVIGTYSSGQTTAADSDYALYPSAHYLVAFRQAISCNPSRSTSTILSNMIQNTGVGIADAGAPVQIYVAPNPVTSTLSIYIDESVHTDASISLTDVTGRLVYEGKALQHKTEIAMDSWASGLYLCKVQRGTDAQIFRIVKK